MKYSSIVETDDSEQTAVHAVASLLDARVRCGGAKSDIMESVVIADSRRNITFERRVVSSEAGRGSGAASVVARTSETAYGAVHTYDLRLHNHISQRRRALCLTAACYNSLPSCKP